MFKFDDTLKQVEKQNHHIICPKMWIPGLTLSKWLISLDLGFLVKARKRVQFPSDIVIYTETEYIWDNESMKRHLEKDIFKMGSYLSASGSWLIFLVMISKMWFSLTVSSSGFSILSLKLKMIVSIM